MDSPFAYLCSMHFQSAICRFILLNLLFWGVPTTAQELIPLGQWRQHVATARATAVSSCDSKIWYVAGGALFKYEADELRQYGPAENLPASPVVALACQGEQVLLAHQNGTLSLLQNERAQVLTTLSQLADTRAAAKLIFVGNQVFALLENGFAAISKNPFAVKELYNNIGLEASAIVASDLLFQNGTYFLASPAGLFAATENTNLNDWQNWRQLLQKPVTSLAAAENEEELYLATPQGISLFLVDEEKEAAELALPLVRQLLAISTTEVLALAGDEVLEISRNAGELKATPLATAPLSEPQQIAALPAGLAIADQAQGLVLPTQVLVGPGPLSAMPTDLYYGNNSILAFEAETGNGFSVFSKGEWLKFGGVGQQVPFNSALSAAAYAPMLEAWLLATRQGLFAYQTAEQQVVRLPLNGFSFPLSRSLSYTDFSALAVSPSGEVWAAVRQPENGFPLYVRTTDGAWQQVPLQLPEAQLIAVLAAAGQGLVYLADELGSGLVVVNAQGQHRIFTSSGSGLNTLPSNDINALHLDRNGALWVGTAEGIATIFAPQAGLTDTQVQPVQPIFKDAPLLSGEFITAITSDAGNRKWMGTRNGLFLFSATVQSLLAEFTTANAPLPANEIQSVAVHLPTGEIFVATTSGLISYRSASSSESVAEKVRVFPNPVPEGFSGQIGLSGLPTDALFKISDSNGQLVYEGQAAGNTASWDGRRQDGTAVAKGVYLIYAGTELGQERVVGKLLLLR